MNYINEHVFVVTSNLYKAARTAEKAIQDFRRIAEMLEDIYTHRPYDKEIRFDLSRLNLFAYKMRRYAQEALNRIEVVEDYLNAIKLKDKKS